jgi:hypothetical protein
MQTVQYFIIAKAMLCLDAILDSSFVCRDSRWRPLDAVDNTILTPHLTHRHDAGSRGAGAGRVAAVSIRIGSSGGFEFVLVDPHAN